MSSEVTAAEIRLFATGPAGASIAATLVAAGFWDPAAGVGIPAGTVTDGVTYLAEAAACRVGIDTLGPEFEALGVAYELTMQPAAGLDGYYRAFVPGLGVFESGCDANGYPVIRCTDVDERIASTGPSELAAELDKATGRTHRRAFDLIASGDRKYFRTIVQVEVLSQDGPWDGPETHELGALNYAITEGDCSGAVTVISTEELSGPEAARALMAQGSDPEFFGLDHFGAPACD
jgi:hypothetical protein